MQSSLLTFRDIVRMAAVLICIVLVLLYIMYQARFLITGPQIILTGDASLQHNERAVTLTGTTQNISRLWLNGRPIFTDPQGAFATDVILENGYTITKLEAEDRYGRRTSLTREFVYAPMSFTYNQ